MAGVRASAELGAIYEASLPLVVRKQRGVWFTPPDLAMEMATAALRLVLKDRASRAEPPGKIRVLDPACGAGIFLAAVREAFGQVAAEFGLARAPDLELVGCDIDGDALIVAGQALGAPASGGPVSGRLGAPASRRPHEAGEPLVLLLGDSILDVDFGRGSDAFDLVITNPPYVRADGGPEIATLRRRIEASGRFESLAAKWDLAAAFVERGLQLCRPGGLAVYLLQDTYRRAEYARAQQAWLCAAHAVRRLDVFDGLRAFDAGVGSIALYVERGGRRSAEGERNGELARERDDQAARPQPAFGWEPAADRPGLVPLEQLAFISYGLRANSDERRYKGAFVTADLLADAPDTAHPRKYTEGKDLGGFRVRRTRYLEWGTDRAPAHFARRSFTEFLEARPKILALCISGREVRAALDLEGHAFNHTAVGIVPWKALTGVSNAQTARAARGLPAVAAPEVDIRYLLAVLHSRQTRDSLWRTRRSDKHVYPGDWRRVGVPICAPEDQAAIAREVDRALALPYPSKAFAAAEARIQALVDEAFGSAVGR